MSPKEIKTLLKDRPFVGLRFYVSDGESYDIRHPDMVLVTDRVVHIAKPPVVEDVPSGGSIYIDPLHVTRIEPLPEEKRSRGREGGNGHPGSET